MPDSSCSSVSVGSELFESLAKNFHQSVALLAPRTTILTMLLVAALDCRCCLDAADSSVEFTRIGDSGTCVLRSTQSILSTAHSCASHFEAQALKELHPGDPSESFSVALNLRPSPLEGYLLTLAASR